MKEFVPLDHGGCISSSSSLSPLAPPFKLDTSFPRPISHPLGNIPEPHGREPYFDGDSNYFFAARPPHDNWLQMNSPNFVPNLFPSPNPSLSLSLGTNPVLPVCTASASANGQSTTNFISSESVSRPYHPQHSSASVQCSIAPFTVDKLDDKLLESGFAPVGGFWNQNNCAQLWEASYPPNYGRLVNQGKSTTAGFPGGDRPSKVRVGKSDGSLAGKPYAGSRCTNLSAQKLSSESDENSGGVQFATSRSSVSNPVSQQEMRYQCATSSNLSMETWSQLNPTIVSYGSHFTGFDPYKQDPLCFYPAASNFYETPSTIGSYTGLVNKTMPSNMNPIEPPKDACNRKETFESQSSSSTACIPANSERSKIYGDTSRINGLVEENNDPFMDPSMLINVNSPRHTPHRVTPMNNVQVTDTLVTETREDTAFHCSSEELEQFNPGVDSPCWKGALDSRYSLFGAAEGEGNSFNIQGTQNLPVNSNNAVEFSTLETQRNGKHFGENGPFSFMKQSSPVVSPSRDIRPNFFEGGSNHSQLSNEHVNQYSVHGNTNGGSGIKPSRTNKFSFQKGNVDMKQHNCEGGMADSGIGFKDPANFGTIQFPYHVSDHYSSLLSRDNVPIDCSPTESTADSFDDDTFNGRKLTSGNVQTVVNLMHNLSESLLSYCSEDEHALKEHDYVVIRQTVQNLETYLVRVGKMSLMPKTHSPPPETTNCSGNPIKVHKGTVVSQSEATNTKVQDVQRCYTQNGCEEKKNSSISMKEVDSPPLTFPRNDLDEKDDSTKRIRIVLEENFHEEESDMQLYKSLWLEAEAELCSQKYKERFARMKNGMEKYKKHLTNELSDVDKPPSSKVTSEGDRDPIVKSSSEVSVDREIPKVPIQEQNQLNYSHTDDDASVMARFHILKSRMNTIPIDEERQPHDFHLGIEKMQSNPNSENAEDIVMKQQQQEVVAKRNLWTFFSGIEAKDLSKSNYQDRMEFGAMQSAITSVLLEHSSGGGSDSPSPGWEHVIKEGTYWV